MNKKLICICGQKKHRQAKQCKQCQIKENYNKLISQSEKTIQEMLYCGESSPYRFVYIRKNAKKLMDYWGIKKKCICGYDKHVECCHIKPITDFPLEIKVKVVNSKENLVYLCPNCHWEFDNGLLKL